MEVREADIYGAGTPHPFLKAAVRAVSLVRPVPLFLLFAVLYGLLWNKYR